MAWEGSVFTLNYFVDFKPPEFSFFYAASNPFSYRSALPFILLAFTFILFSLALSAFHRSFWQWVYCFNASVNSTFW
jgi:hypothetical protein